MRCDQNASNIFSESFRSADVAERTKIHNNSSGLSPPTPLTTSPVLCSRRVKNLLPCFSPESLALLSETGDWHSHYFAFSTLLRTFKFMIITAPRRGWRVFFSLKWLCASCELDVMTNVSGGEKALNFYRRSNVRLWAGRSFVTEKEEDNLRFNFSCDDVSR